MNDEPTYHYVKGQGWIPTYAPASSYTSHDFICEVINGHRVTVERRHPKIGEHYYNEGRTGMTPVSRTLNNIRGRVSEGRNPAPVWHGSTLYGVEPHIGFVVVTVE
jgi:hypothetical protein